jgi:hypothetical protein
MSDGTLNFQGAVEQVYKEMIDGSISEFVEELEDPVRREAQLLQHGMATPSLRVFAEWQAAILLAMEKAGCTAEVLQYVDEKEKECTSDECWGRRVKHHLFSPMGFDPAWVGWRIP